MNKIKVIKEFPGVEVGDVLEYSEATNLYEIIKENVEIGEDYEDESFSAVSYSPEIIEDNMGIYFDRVFDKPEADFQPKSIVEIVAKRTGLLDSLDGEMYDEDRKIIYAIIDTIDWILGNIQD